MHRNRAGRLERSCRALGRDWIRAAPPQPGFERIEAAFAGHGYDPHRHDSYAVGLTVHGVQAFRYRGDLCHSLPGQAVVLHPDELHDGRAGTDGGFRYRIAYIDPRLIGNALGIAGASLPFVRDPVTSDMRLVSALGATLDDLDVPLEALQIDEALTSLAEIFAELGGSRPRGWSKAASARAVDRACDFLDASIDRAVGSAELEAVTGLSRFALSRHFRALCGTSPYRYLVMRRLTRARQLIVSGAALAETAAATGFADQSHLSRHFRKAYGMSPGRWRRIAGGVDAQGDLG